MFNWFQRKSNNNKKATDLHELFLSLENRILDLETKYKNLMVEFKDLKSENVETTNELYRLENSLDARIDILGEYIRSEKNV